MTKFQDEFSEEIWESTYKDYNDKTIDDTFRRVAKAVASIEKNSDLRLEWEEKFFDMLGDFKVVPGGRIISNSGTEWKGTTLLNCFVSPHPKEDADSLEGILKVLKDQAFTLKTEGGWGHNFSLLRPRGSFIHGIGIDSPGSVKYMELFDQSSDIITSGSGLSSSNEKVKGKIRKGAQMTILDCWHPDIIEFITAKQTPGRLTKFNMSVNCTNEFMEKVLQVKKLKENKANKKAIEEITWDLIFPDTTHSVYKKEWFGDIKSWKSKGYPIKIYRTVTVDWLWNLIMESTYNRAEPGVLFLDRANELNELNYAETIYSTNPCSEQTLAPGGCCNLSSVNLTQFYSNKKIQYKKLKKYVKTAVRFLDNINTLSNAALPEYIDSMRNKRRIGLGIMGWGSLLFMMKIRFASKQANQIREKIMKTITYTAIDESICLAKEKGMFKYCDPEKHARALFFKQINIPSKQLNRIRKNGIRNSSLFSIQPTGNSSILSNIVSGGLEPIFMTEYIRTVIVNKIPDEIREVTPKYYEGEFHETEFFKFTKEGDEQILIGKSENGTVYKIDKNRGLTKEVLCEDYGVRYLKNLGEWDKKADWAITTDNLSAEDHLNDLSGFSKWLDSSASKTINLPQSYSLENFKNIYLDAYQTGYIKGVTTYRAGTMATVLAAKDETDHDNGEEIIKADVKLPIDAVARVKTLKAEGRKWYLTVTFHDDNLHRPFALFVHTNAREKGVTTNDAVDRLMTLAQKKKIPKRHIDGVLIKIENENNTSKLARSISFLLRHGVLIKNIVAELERTEDVFAGSFLFQIKKYLSQYIKDGTPVEDVKCENCGSKNIVFSEGCFKCMSCSSSKCG